MKRKTKRKSNLINKTGFTPGFDTENNFINYIPSEDITMRNTPYPLNATPLDQYGNPIGQTVTMQPGQDYRFGGASYVAETRMFKDGGKQEWISNKIGELVREGRPQKQAIAIAYSMYEQKHELGGRQLPMLQKGPEDMGGFRDPSMPDLGPNPFGQTAVTALPSNITSNSQYDINKTSQGLPANWSTGVTQQKIQPLSLPKPAGGVPTTSMPGTTPAQQITQGPAGAAVDTLAERQGQENARNERDARADFESGARRHQFVDPYSGYGIGESLAGAGIAAGQGKTGEAVLFGANALLQGTKSFLSGMGAGKRNANLTRSMYENERDYMMGKPQYEEGGEAEDDTEMEDMDDMDDLPMKQRIAMLAQSYQMPELNLPQYETQQQEEMRKGGYYKFGGKKYPMYQNAGMSEDENSDLVNKYYNQEKLRQEVQQRFVPQPAIYPQPEPAMNGFGIPTTTTEPQLTQTAKEQPKEVWQIWQEVTGKPWSAAKKEGFTDGSAKANMALADRLLKGEKISPIKKVQAPVKNQTEDNRTYYGGQLKEVVVMAPKKKVAPGRFMLTSDKAYQDYVKSNRMRVPNTPPNPNLLITSSPMDFNPEKQTPMFRQVYQEGGMQSQMEEQQEGAMSNPQEEQGEIPQQLMEQVAAMLQQGASPQEILQQLVQAGIPQEQAAQIIQSIMQQMQQQQPSMSQGEYYQVGGKKVQSVMYGNVAPEQSEADKVFGTMGQRAAARKTLVNRDMKDATTTALQMPLIYLSNPLKVLGDAAHYVAPGSRVDNWLPNSQEDRREVLNNRYDSGISANEKLRRNLIIGAKKTPMAALNVGAGIYFAGEKGAAAIANEVFNPVRQVQHVMHGQGLVPRAVNAAEVGVHHTAGHGLESIIYHQEGGMQPEMEAPQEGMTQQGGGDQMQQIMAQVASMLQQGASPQEVLQQLVQAGIPQEQAAQIVQAAMQQVQGGQQATPQLGYGGYYQEGGQEMPAQQPQDQGNQMGQVVAQIAQALQQGANPEEVLQQLIQMGVPEQEASQMIQMVMQQMQQAQGAQQAPPQEEMQQTMKMGGKYLNMLRGKTIKSYKYNPKTDSYDIQYK